MNNTAAVIGAGLGGIATAIRLASKGYQVTVYDSRETLGGKAGQLKAEGFTFDTGPSLFTLPEEVSELLRLAEMDPEQALPTVKLDPVCHYHFADGVRFNSPGNPKNWPSSAQRAFGENGVEKYLNMAQHIYDVTTPVFLNQSLHKLKGYFSKETWRGITQLHRIQAGKSLHQLNEQILKEPHLVQLFNRYATYNGSNPYKAPGTLSVISHIESVLGAWYPKGGIRSIPLQLGVAADKLGVQFYFNQKVKKVIPSNKGYIVEGEMAQEYGSVIFNADIHYIYKDLIPWTKAPERILRQERSSSGIIFYWGINKKHPDLHLHNIFFSEDYQKEFKGIFNHHSIPEDLTVYINITSKMDAHHAPEGMENWFVMVNVPGVSNINWDEEVEKVRTQIIRKLSLALGEQLHKHIVYEKVMHPKDIDQQTGSWLGSLYGPSSNNTFAAFLRHPNFRKRYPGLFFTGGSVHPGGGIPLVLKSAKIVSNEFPSLRS